MAYFKSFTAGGSNGNSTTLRIDRDIHTLLVRRLSTIQTDYGLREHNPETVDATIRNHTGKLEDVIKRCSLADLAAYSQYGGAPILEVFSAEGEQDNVRATLDITEGLAIPTDTKWVTVFAISLTADGLCVATDAQEDFVFSFGNLPDGAVYDFIGLEGEATGTNILRYETIEMLKDQRERDLDVDNMIGIVMPSTVAFTRLLLTHATGRISKYTLAELKYLAAQHNPFTLAQTFGYGQHRLFPAVQMDVLAMPLHSVTRIEMDTNGTPLSFLTVYNRSRMAA